METKFTKTLHPHQYGEDWIIQTEPNWDGGLNVLDGKQIGATEAEANAKLFAAAPCLFEALRIMVDAYYYGIGIPSEEALEQAEAALKKATA